MRTGHLLAILLFTASGSAWPWPRGTSLFQREVAPLALRADQSSQQQKPSAADTRQQSTAQATETRSSGHDQKSTAASGSDAKQTTAASESGAKSSDQAVSSGVTESGNQSGKNSKATKTSSKGKHKPSKNVTISADAGVGGISMLTPAATTSSYYKIGDHVTFAWNYTSLTSTPSAVAVLASCSSNAATYTIASNMSFAQGSNEDNANASQAVTWDTSKFQKTATVKLLTATYTLIVMDAEMHDVDSTASPGYLGVSRQFTFGMYIPMPYANNSDNKVYCATCNGATGLLPARAGLVACLTAAGVVFGFTWFANVAGLW